MNLYPANNIWAPSSLLNINEYLGKLLQVDTNFNELSEIKEKKENLLVNFNSIHTTILKEKSKINWKSRKTKLSTQ